ncbi:unnamed protein product [Effrenium voratum]|uniref:Uncharacterized protein n=1 Tax=Effrenium voratum TaxID=2562239 RepID=A0AA36HNL9_9DINO|nr:unnamed protein product [Effrenium voratum]CAJ1372156.1 unnamed protein product [Effrenium voratum]CAJ1430469.1 unnamed protein product [Effrenium voratum]|mmetsp:Transcript_125293/g.297366  ORF Transcript_125293/g.297366 Transcript_125293/m.297366 type:complete len:210 (+) Transcript_125293:31-660(+)
MEIDPFSLRPWNTAHLADLASTIGEGEVLLHRAALRRLRRPLSPAPFMARKVAQEAVCNYPPVLAQRRLRTSSRDKGRSGSARSRTAYSTSRPSKARASPRRCATQPSWLPRDFEGTPRMRELLAPSVCLTRGLQSSSSAPALEGSPRRGKPAQTLMSLVADGRQSASKREHQRVAQCLQGIVRRTAMVSHAALAFSTEGVDESSDTYE